MMAALHEQVVEQAHLLVRLLEDLGEVGNGPIESLSTSQIAEQLFAGLERMHQTALSLEPQRAFQPTPSTDEKRFAYRELVERVVAKVADMVEAGSVVAVITRGDSALLALAGMTAWHFPRNDDGSWAGFHPANGREAVSQLHDLQRKGVRYLVIPTPSSWWLDFYDEFRDHLRSHAQESFSDADMVLFDLGLVRTATSTTPQVSYYYEQVARFTELIRMLLPVDSNIVVISRGDDVWLDIGRDGAAHFPASADGTYLGHPASDDDAIAALSRAVADGSRYLAMPSPHHWWREVYPRFSDHLRTSHVCIVDQHELGALYELIPAGGRTE